MKMSFRILFWGSTAKWKLEMLLCHLTEPVYIWMAVKNVGICRCVSETWEAVRVSDDDRGIYWRQIDQLPFTTKCSLSTHHSLLQSVSCEAVTRVSGLQCRDQIQVNIWIHFYNVYFIQLLQFESSMRESENMDDPWRIMEHGQAKSGTIK